MTDNTKYKAESILPYQKDESKTGQVRAMFDNIAPAYDFMNRAMTFGIDKLWRRKAVKLLRPYCPKHILDVATGTGDLAFLLYSKLKPLSIEGIDLSTGMLEVARKKATKMGFQDKVSFTTGDCLHLTYSDNMFDAITVAYGVRNFEHLLQGYTEMYRVLQRDGVLCVIELSTPKGKITRPLYNFYSRTLIPLVGRAISHDSRAYSYLPESIAAVAQGNDMLEIMREAGFKKARCIELTFGACSIYIAEK